MCLSLAPAKRMDGVVIQFVAWPSPLALTEGDPVPHGLKTLTVGEVAESP